MLDSHACAGFIECVIAAGLLVFRGKAVSKLRAVVGQYFGNLDRRSLLQTAQEVYAALVRHVAIDVHEHPASSLINCHEQVASRGLVRHLRPNI